MVKKNKTGDLLLNSGSLLKFSKSGLKRVLNDSKCCVLCGSLFETDGDLVETREHIIPEWVIGHCELQDTFAMQPNRQRIPYARLTVRCCKKCNSSYSDLFETPLSKVFKSGYESVRSLIDEKGGQSLLFGWVSFIAAKKRQHSAMHRFDQNTQVNSEYFEDEQGLESISWMLAAPNSLRFGNKEKFARFLFVLPTVAHNDKPATFDFVIDPLANTALLTIGNTSVICGFSHSCPEKLTASVMQGFPSSMTFNQLQIRELFAEFSAQALSFERKYYRIREYDGRLSLVMDETPCSQLLALPRSFWVQLLIRSMGDLPVRYITSEAYFSFVVSELSKGRGSFFSNRAGQPFFDPSLFHDPGSELTEDTYNQRVRELQILAKVKEPLRFQELQEEFGHGA